MATQEEVQEEEAQEEAHSWMKDISKLTDEQCEELNEKLRVLLRKPAE